MYDVFISHSSKNKQETVLPLVECLESKGVTVWIDQKEILYGENILDKVTEGIHNSYVMVLILTKEFFNSFWTSLELGYSLAKPFSNNIIPIIVDVPRDLIQEKFPWILTIKYIEYSSEALPDIVSKITSVINFQKSQSRHKTPEFIYREAVRNIRNYDMPVPNKISILLSEYEQIARINMKAAFFQASCISKVIVDFLAEKYNSNQSSTSYLETLDQLMDYPSGLNWNIYSHLKLLLEENSEKLNSSFSSDISKKKLVDMSLASLLDWFSSFLRTSVSPVDDCFTLAMPGTLSSKDFNDMYTIDTMVLRDDLIAPANVTQTWYDYNVHSHIALRSQSTKEIIGYLVMLPITEELFVEIQNGTFKDNDLSIKNIRRFDVPDFYFLYIACIAVHPKYQNTKAFSYLYKSGIQLLLDLAVEREIFIVEIITEASTLQGEKLCKIIGLKKTIETKLNTSIYQGTLLPPSLRLKSNSGSKLIRFYQEKYEEFKALF